MKKLAQNERSVSLIVRLGPSTPPKHLRRAHQLSTVKIRFFTAPEFHTKLYIFGESAALVGSANLTDSGLQRNREVAVTVQADTPDFEELVALFGAYWSQAVVLNEERLERYQKRWEERQTSRADKDFESAIEDEFGDHLPEEGIQVDPRGHTGEKLFLEDYRRRYQDFLQAFQKVRQIYESYETRKEDKLPLRIEIHEFLSFVRQAHCSGESWADVPILSKDEQEARTRELLDQWFETEWSYLEEIASRYPLIVDQLGTPEKIDEADMESLIEALWVCHAFKEQSRFHPGGAATFRKTFRKNVDVGRLKDSLKYLLHGDDEYVERMGTLIYDHTYKIPHMARNVVQELMGWVNKEGIPLSNRRARMALSCLGFDVQV